LNAAGGANVAVGNEFLTLNGALVGSGATTADGRLITLDSPSGGNSLGGPVTLANAAGLAGVVLANAPSGAGLSLVGPVTQTQAATAGLTLTGGGAYGLGGTATNTYRGTTTAETGTLTLAKPAGV